MHKDCEYSENLYEFLFNYEKQQSGKFVNISRPGKSHEKNSLISKNSTKSLNELKSKSSVCLKFPIKEKSTINSMNLRLVLASPKELSYKKGFHQKKVIKSPNILSIPRSTINKSPYLSLSPKHKDVIVRSPKVVRTISKLS